LRLRFFGAREFNFPQSKFLPICGSILYVPP